MKIIRKSFEKMAKDIKNNTTSTDNLSKEITECNVIEHEQAEMDLRQAKEFIDNAINAQIDTFFVFIHGYDDAEYERIRCHNGTSKRGSGNARSCFDC